MLEIRAEHAIATLVDGMLPVGSEKGLHVALLVRTSNYKATYDKKRNVVPYKGVDGDNYNPAESSRTIHFLFLRPTHYTKVWSAVEGRYQRRPALASWEMTSDHDSCWRDDGFSPLREAEVAMDWEVSVSQDGVVESRGFYRYVNIETVEFVTVEHAPKPGDSYHRIVTKVA